MRPLPPPSAVFFLARKTYSLAGCFLRVVFTVMTPFVILLIVRMFILMVFHRPGSFGVPNIKLFL